jgi:hypothetical protein
LSQIKSDLVYPVTAIGTKSFPPEVGRPNAENAQNSLSPSRGNVGDDKHSLVPEKDPVKRLLKNAQIQDARNPEE